ncbi:2-octaprenyl-6-methoxyphenyl hydroxylase [Rickettsia sp. TH2014]|uniref:2-octaprenyl-6-methoxyphenyl hydroxylase n=1 Tax=Rickettsia sp. TH2014 TaxID=1967503 RepID=UPI001C47ECD5|nr:2-octaprenyl-6-methoxyphenyl hydroxylase [Rickettsia sp. TH2014]
MSKEKLNTSSINTPEEGIKNAAEDNKIKSSINTPERVESLEAAQTNASELPQERQSQNKPAEKER